MVSRTGVAIKRANTAKGLCMCSCVQTHIYTNISSFDVCMCTDTTGISCGIHTYVKVVVVGGEVKERVKLLAILSASTPEA